MPSDRFYDKMYEAEDRYRNKIIKETQEYYKNKFNNMTLEEKIDFLLNAYVNNEIDTIE